MYSVFFFKFVLTSDSYYSVENVFSREKFLITDKPKHNSWLYVLSYSWITVHRPITKYVHFVYNQSIIYKPKKICRCSNPTYTIWLIGIATIAVIGSTWMVCVIIFRSGEELFFILEFLQSLPVTRSRYRRPETPPVMQPLHSVSTSFSYQSTWTVYMDWTGASYGITSYIIITCN